MKITPPDIAYSFKEIMRLRQPLVYAYVRFSRVLYIGSSSQGIARPFTRNHKCFDRLEPGDELKIWFCKNTKQARKLEESLIYKERPEWNINGNFRGLAPRYCLKCKQTIVPDRGRKYCSSYCRISAYWKRKEMNGIDEKDK